MGDITSKLNLGALIEIVPLAAPLSWTAGGASDNLAIVGPAINRMGFVVSPTVPKIVDADVVWAAQLASGQSLSLKLEIDTSLTPSGPWTVYATEAPTVVGIGPSGGGLVSGVFRMTPPNIDNQQSVPGVNLSSAQRYVRAQVTPHLSASTSDTATIASFGVFSGFDDLNA
jgi:hypothetical protein